MNDSAKYRALPAFSPYAKSTRYDLLKEDHKYFIAKLKRTVETGKPQSLVDVGCGNGEMIHQFRKVFPAWEYSGFDYTPEFIRTAKEYPGLAGVTFDCKDIYDTPGQYDIVFCSSVFQIFAEPEKPLRKLLSLCREGGWLFIDGLFNPYDIEVRFQYCDNTHKETEGLWRCDWNRHSQKTMRKLLEGHARSVSFEEVPMNLDIPLKPDMPINRFTFRDANGKNIITNGTHAMLNRVLMTVQK